MSGLASVVNPLDPHAKAVQVFYVTPNRHLAVQFKPITNQTIFEHKYEAADKDEYDDGVVEPSAHLATGYFQGAHAVIGFTQPKSEAAAAGTPSFRNISMLSPVYSIIDSDVELANTSVTFISNELVASVWYLSGTDRDTKLIEYSLIDNSRSRTVNRKPIMPGSSLAGYAVGEQQFVIFQDDDDKFHEYDSESDEAPLIKAIIGAFKKTTLAVTYVDSKKTAYLYYTTADGDIYRSAKRGKEWQTPVHITASYKVDVTSQLAVVHSRGINHIYWVPKNGNKPGKGPVTAKDLKLDA